MLRILLWRLVTELLSLVKWLGFRGPSVRYFAYGANLDPAVLARRNVTIHSCRTYVLRDYAFRFNHKIPFEGAAMASIEPLPGESVVGALYEIPLIDLLRLDCMEASVVFRRYRRRSFRGSNGEKIFFYQSNVSAEGLRPPLAYITKIVNGYRMLAPEHETAIEALLRLETVSQLVPAARPEFLVGDYRMFGPALEPWLVRYDRWCVRVFGSLILRPAYFDGKRGRE